MTYTELQIKELFKWVSYKITECGIDNKTVDDWLYNEFKEAKPKGWEEKQSSLSEDMFSSMSEITEFGGWLSDNWKFTKENIWQNKHTYEMIDTTEELFEQFKSNKA